MVVNTIGASAPDVNVVWILADNVTVYILDHQIQVCNMHKNSLCHLRIYHKKDWLDFIYPLGY